MKEIKMRGMNEIENRVKKETERGNEGMEDASM
jgi:hypothetical protein